MCLDVTAAIFSKPVSCEIINSIAWLLQLWVLSLSLPCPQSRGKVLCKKRRKKRIFNNNLTLASHVLFKTSLHPKSPAWQTVQSDSRTGSTHAWASQVALAASTGPQRPLDLSPPPSLPYQILHHLCRVICSDVFMKHLMQMWVLDSLTPV